MGRTNWTVAVEVTKQPDMARDLAYLDLINRRTGERFSLGLVNLTDGTLINGPCAALQPKEDTP